MSYGAGDANAYELFSDESMGFKMLAFRTIFLVLVCFRKRLRWGITWLLGAGILLWVGF